ncbi:hypothetical protein GCM10008094_08470 [Aidingimonas halophila]|nr:hypothetical protein GCM10008094_08470 [Aidingimonas halophila]
MGEKRPKNAPARQTRRPERRNKAVDVIATTYYRPKETISYATPGPESRFSVRIMATGLSHRVPEAGVGESMNARCLAVDRRAGPAYR